MSVDEAPRAAVVGENEGRGMPDMAVGVTSAAETPASAQGALAPQQVIAKTVNEASASMQQQSAEPREALQNSAGNSQPSLIPNGQRDQRSALNGRLQSHRVDSTDPTP